MFEIQQKTLFKHCDPAGIVFYPRYFEMMNDCVEAFFDQVLQVPFEDLHATGGVPTVQIETRFAAPSRHGDMLTLRLEITRVGESSATYHLTCNCSDQLRFDTKAVLVFVDADGAARPWPANLRTKLIAFQEGEI